MYLSWSICPFVIHKGDHITISKFLTPCLFCLLFESKNKITIIKVALILREKENGEEKGGGKF